MDYVINPNFIYWIQVIGSIYNLLQALLIISIISLLLFLILNIIFNFDSDYKDKYYDDRKKLTKKISLISLIITIVLTIIVIFTPSKTTLIAIEISKNITYTNVNKAKKEIKETVDYIFEKINNLNNKK